MYFTGRHENDIAGFDRLFNIIQFDLPTAKVKQPVNCPAEGGYSQNLK